MAAKEEISDAAEQLEQKRKELRESLRREALALEQLQATQLCMQELQREVILKWNPVAMGTRISYDMFTCGIGIPIKY